MCDVTKGLQKSIDQLKCDPVAIKQAAEEFALHPDFAEIIHLCGHAHQYLGVARLQQEMDKIYLSIAIEIAATDVLDDC